MPTVTDDAEEDEAMKADQDIAIAEEEVAFYLEIGMALRQWAAIEGQLRSLVGMCVSPVDSHTIADGLMAVDSFRSKLKFCDVVVRKKCSSPEHIAEWNRLYVQLEAKSQIRNYIAHGQYVLNPNGIGGRRFGIVKWNEPEPVSVSSKGNATLVSDALCVRKIAGARLRFHKLTSQLLAFQISLRGLPKLPPAFDGPASDAPDLRSTRNRIRLALGMPHLPVRRSPGNPVGSLI